MNSLVAHAVLRRSRLILIAALVALVAAVVGYTSRPQMPQPAHSLRLNGLDLLAFNKGAKMYVTRADVNGRISVRSFNWSAAAAGGHVTVSEFDLSRRMDAKSPTLLAELTNGTQSDTTIVVNHVVKGAVVESVHYTLSNATVVTVGESAAAGSAAPEKVSLTFTSTEIQYFKKGVLVDSTTVTPS